MQQIYLLRHAQSAPNFELLNSEWPLSQRGLRQAEGLKNLLDKLAIDAIYSSPYLRCQQTILPFSQHSGLAIHYHDGLREIKLVPTFVKNFDEIQRKSWAYFSFALAGCESSKVCQNRIYTSIKEIATKERGKTLVVSSHGNAIALLLNKIDASFRFEQFRRIRNPDLFLLGFDGESFTWQKHLPVQDELALLVGG